MTDDNKTPAFKAQFEEIAQLETALRSGELTEQAAADALRQLHQLMDWQIEDEQPASDIEYLYA